MRLVNIVKPTLALLLTPLLVALAWTTTTILTELCALPETRKGLQYALSGFGFWVVLFYVFPRPTPLYVFAHEMAHVIVATLLGVKVGRMRLGRERGQVEIWREHWLIHLAPYFLPMYLLGAMVLYGVAHLFGGPGQLHLLWVAGMGLLWGFHATFTLHAILRRQEDIRLEGKVFSFILIAFGNLLMFALWMGLIFRRHFSCWDWVSSVGRNLMRLFGF